MSKLQQILAERTALHLRIVQHIFGQGCEKRRKQELGVFLCALTAEELERGLADLEAVHQVGAEPIP